MKPIILIVDDEKNTREGLKKALESSGYAIALASGADEALRIMERQKVDILLTDLKMPRVNGMELMRRAGKLHADTITILLTAYGTVESAVACVRNGAVDYLLKPFSPEAFQEAVARALAGRRAAGEPDDLADLVAEDPVTLEALDLALRAARSA